MNATCKRLLSWLVVVTMVLSMVPVMDLSNFAVTTKAAENPAKDTLTAIEALRETFATAAATNATVSAICPVCGGEEAAEWTPLTGATAQLANPNGHYYLSGDVTFTAAGTSFSSNNNTLCLNLNGNDITAGGIALNISYGNVVNVMDSAEKDGTVTGTAANFQGGAINVGNANARFNIYGGTFKKTGATGSVVCVRNNGGTVNMYGGTIDASDASNNACASTINVMSGANVTTTFNLYDGVVKCGTMTAGGLNYRANIMLGYGNNSGATFNMEGGTVVGGNYTGAAGGGGATFAVVMGSTLRISGGTVYGGTSNSSGANIFSINNGAGNLEISGGTIVGEVYTRNAVNVTLSGEPQIITSLELESGETVTATRGFDVSAATTIDATGLTGGNIQVSGVGLGKVLPVTCTDAAEAAEYFSHVDATLDIGANDANQLVVVEYVEPEEPVEEPEVGVFAPESCGGMAYCDACMDAGVSEEEALVEWTEIKGTGLAALSTPNGHYYLSDDATFTAAGTSFSSNSNTLCLHLNDHTLTAGGVAIQVTYGNTVNIMGEGTVKGTAANGGAAINVNNPNAEVNIFGGTFEKVSGAKGAVVGIGAQGGVVNMYGGTIDASGTESDSWATTISMMGAAGQKNAIFNLYEGDIKCGTITKLSGNYLGNINIGYTAAYAGGAEFNMMGGTVSGGTHTAPNGVVGGNFAVTNGNYLNVSGGTIYGGRTGVNGANISVRSGEGNVHISGGTIVGDISIPSTGTLKLSGDPQIVTSLEIGGKTVTAENGGIHVTGSSNIDISELTADASIAVTGSKGAAFTAAHTNAANVVESFVSTNTDLVVSVTNENQLMFNDKVVEPEYDEPEVGVFDPVACGGKAYCEACTDANGGEPVLIEEWTALTGNNLSALANPNGHYYLSSDISFTANGTSYTSNGNKLCLHLNDCSITAGGIALNITYGNTINVMGEGVVSGTSTDGGSTTNVNNKNGVLNIYGGAFQNTENGTGAVIGIGAQGGTVNMYAGTIDAENATSAKWATAISIMGDKNGDDYPGVFNLYEGEIYCGTTSTNRGNIMVGYDTARANGATFNMMGGTVYGGTNTANSYGTFLVQYGGTLNVTGGTIYGGTAKGAGANIFLSGNADYTATLNVSDGEICGDVYANQYATVNLSDAAKIVKELTVYNETVTAEGTGLYVYEGVLVNIDGLTAEAEVYIAGKLDTALTTGTGVTSGIKAYEASQYTEAVEGVVYLRQAKAAVVTAEGENFYPTVEEAVANVGNGYIELHADGLTVTINGETYIDNRGHNVTVEGEGKLYAMDAANDDYVGYGSWTVNGPEVATDVINPVNGNRYIVILNDEGTAYSAHRVELYLTHISLRTSQAGLYYRAAYKADAALADRVMAYGIVFSAVDGEVHQGNFDKDVNIYSVMDGFKDNLVENTVDKGTSTAVFGIFKNDGTRTNSENVAAGEAKIHATPYINVDVDGDGIEDTDPYVIGNVQNDVYKANAGVVYAAQSLYDVLKAINDDWTNYESVQGKVQGFYDDWANYGMSEWATDLANIAG